MHDYIKTDWYGNDFECDWIVISFSTIFFPISDPAFEDILHHGYPNICQIWQKVAQLGKINGDKKCL